MDIAVVGRGRLWREMEERSRGGGETAGQLLSSSKIIVMIRIQDGDIDIGDGAEAGGTRAC